MPRFDVGAVIICDEIRKEVTGKDILIGVYGGKILVRTIPATIPIAVWMEIEAHDVGIIQFELKVGQPGEQRLAEVELELSVSSHARDIALGTPTLPCLISRDGVIEVSIRDPGEAEWTVVKTKRVAMRPASAGETAVERGASDRPPPEPSRNDVRETRDRASARRVAARRPPRTERT
jgi:hypothetical protein